MGQISVPLFNKSPELNVTFQDFSVRQYQVAGFYDPRRESITTTDGKSAVNEPFIEFNTGDGILSLRLSRIQSLEPYSPRTIDVVSGTDVRYFSLGNAAAQIVPDPPDWYKFGGLTQQWKPASLAHPHFSWFYIPGAAWIWRTSNLDRTSGEVVLFRHAFDIPKEFKIVDARLDLTADYRVAELYLNEEGIALDEHILNGDAIHYNVRSFLQNGENLLAVKTMNEERRNLNFAGVAWRVRIKGYTTENPPTAEPPGAVVFLLNGDVVCGTFETIRDSHLALATDIGRLNLAIPWLGVLRLNYEKKSVPVETSQSSRNRSFFDKLLGRDKKKARAPAMKLVHEPLAWHEERPYAGIPDFPGLRTKSGKIIRGEPVGYQAHKLIIRTEYGNAAVVQLDAIDSIFPTNKRSPGFIRYSDQDMPYVAQVTLTNGNIISGIIDTIEPGYLTIVTAYAGTIKIPYTHLVRCDFLMNSKLPLMDDLKEWGKVRDRAFTVGLIGDPIGSTPQRTADAREVYNHLNRAMMELRLNIIPINAQKQVQDDFLTPDTFDLLVNVDGREHYYHTVKQKADGYKALKGYIEKGGNLLIMGAGVPFYYGHVRGEHRWLTTTQGEQIINDLGFDIIMPGEYNPGVQSFELPEKPWAQLSFVLVTPQCAPPELQHMPAQIEFPLSADCRFRPVEAGDLPEGDAFYPVYKLIDNTGRAYGTAMALIRRNSSTGSPQYITYVCYQLAQAHAEGKRFFDYLLPATIRAMIEKQ